MKQSSNTFICGLDDAGLLGFLSRIAPQCSQCHYPKMEVCIERCCDTNALYCRQCQRDLHFLHRTNDIRMLFVNKSLLSNSEVLVEQLLTSLLEELTLRSLFVENLINSLVSLAQLYNRNIKDAQERLDLARERRWHTPLYATVGNFISGKLGVEQTRKKAMESFSKMQFHDLPLQLPSLRETVRYLTGLSKDMKNVSVEVEPFKKFFEWTVPKNNFQNVMTDTAYEQFVPQNQLPFSIATSNNRSLIVNAADLKTECVLAKRVKIIGGLPNTQAQLINLASLLPATLELELSFFPKTFPENLKKLVLLNISDRISDQKNCELPQSLVMVRYQTKKDNLDSSTQIVARLAELKNLRAVDLALQGYSWKGLRNAIQMGRQLQLMRLSLANNSAIWGSFESGKRYERHFSLIRQAYTRSLFQVCLMHRSESIQRLCSPFREALLETLEFEKKAK